MKRVLPGFLLLLGIVVQSANGEYVIIRWSNQGVPADPKGGTPAPAIGTKAPGGQPRTVHAAALIEFGKKFIAKTTRVDMITTPLSVNTSLYSDDKSIFVVKGPGSTFFKALPTVTAELKAKKEALIKAPGAANRLELAEWVLARALSISFLEHDNVNPRDYQLMLSEFKEQMEELKKQLDGAPPNVLRVMKAYQDVQAKMTKQLLRDQAAVDRWAGPLNCKVQDEGAHYTVLYKPTGGETSELPSRIKNLENVFEGFYYWFALKGHALEFPDKRLVVVIIDDLREFRDRQATFDAGALAVDGFLARREQLAFFSNEPLNDGYQALRVSNRDLLWTKGWNRGLLLKGDRPSVKLKVKVDANEVDRAMTLALLQRSLEVEGEILAGTHVGVEQLISASGLLPRTVPAPHWLQFGMPSCFAASRGALWNGFGGPNWEYLYQFKRHESDFDPPATALRRVLSDEYFQEALVSGKPDQLRRARCLAWALTYYLAQNELDGLLRYYQELATLPRELELDEGALVGCFARAFKLENPAMPETVDENKLAQMAAKWFQYIGRSTALDKVQLQDLVQIRNELKLDP